MTTKRLTIAAFASVLLCSPAVLIAGQPQDSVADAARKAQAEKKKNIKPKMVIDNDNLGTLTGTVNVVGTEPPAPKDPSKAGAEDKSKEKPAEKGEKYWRDKFADANNHHICWNKRIITKPHTADLASRTLKRCDTHTKPDINAMRAVLSFIKA